MNSPEPAVADTERITLLANIIIEILILDEKPCTAD